MTLPAVNAGTFIVGNEFEPREHPFWPKAKPIFFFLYFFPYLAGSRWDTDNRHNENCWPVWINEDLCSELCYQIKKIFK